MNMNFFPFFLFFFFSFLFWEVRIFPYLLNIWMGKPFFWITSRSHFFFPTFYVNDHWRKDRMWSNNNNSVILERKGCHILIRFCACNGSHLLLINILRLPLWTWLHSSLPLFFWILTSSIVSSIWKQSSVFFFFVLFTAAIYSYKCCTYAF